MIIKGGAVAWWLARWTHDPLIRVWALELYPLIVPLFIQVYKWVKGGGGWRITPRLTTITSRDFTRSRFTPETGDRLDKLRPDEPLGLYAELIFCSSRNSYLIIDCNISHFKRRFPLIQWRTRPLLCRWRSVVLDHLKHWKCLEVASAWLLISTMEVCPWKRAIRKSHTQALFLWWHSRDV